ncbi:MAG TPA: hypothetical protein VFN10_02850 [Thermoanaerobaculia bacterium]|nr:hypothetical protein [Thermoanaerobaculia bacterium]
MPRLDPSRSLLVRGKEEEKGFGLYSYVLFSEQPTAEARVRYVALVSRIVRSVDRTGEMIAVGYKRAELNVIHFPVLRQPTRSATLPEAAEWIVDNYDYARAKKLLRKCSNAKGRGPFLVSSLVPLESTKDLPFIHDLASAGTDTIALWADEFVRVSCTPTHWNEASLTAAMLSVRDRLALVASAGAPVVDAAAHVLAWIRTNLAK